MIKLFRLNSWRAISIERPNEYFKVPGLHPAVARALTFWHVSRHSVRGVFLERPSTTLVHPPLVLPLVLYAKIFGNIPIFRACAP
jgi:hypothetical protein